MSRASLCRALAFSAGVLLSASSAGAATETTEAPTAGLDDAQALINAGEPEAALAILRPLAQGSTVDAGVLFHIGVAAVGASRRPDLSGDAREALLDEAIAAFRIMLVGRPELVRVRLELARAFFLKGEDRLARRHFEQVLAGQPPEAVAQNVHRFLALIRARKRWSVRVGAALAPDSNLTTWSGEKTLLIDTAFGRLPFVYEGNERESGVGVAVWASGEYQYPLGGAAGGAAESRWRLRAGGDVSRREYRGSAFDRMTVAGHAGPRRLIGRASEGSVLLSALHHQTGAGDEKLSYRDVGLRLEGRHRLTGRTTVHGRLSQHERRYDGVADRDGPITDLSLGTGWIASPTVRVEALLGWTRERTESEQWRHSRRWVQIGATAALPRHHLPKPLESGRSCDRHRCDVHCAIEEGPHHGFHEHGP